MYNLDNTETIPTAVLNSLVPAAIAALEKATGEKYGPFSLILLSKEEAIDNTMHYPEGSDDVVLLNEIENALALEKYKGALENVFYQIRLALIKCGVHAGFMNFEGFGYITETEGADIIGILDAKTEEFTKKHGGYIGDGLQYRLPSN